MQPSSLVHWVRYPISREQVTVLAIYTPNHEVPYALCIDHVDPSRRAGYPYGINGGRATTWLKWPVFMQLDPTLYPAWACAA